MTVREAVIEAFCKDTWIAFPEEPTSVDVYFVGKEGFEDSTQLDLYAGSNSGRIAELTALWNSLCDELGTDLDGITGITAYGYICN